MDSFANHPPSVAEIRSDKTKNGNDWTPRDALICALREIDNGTMKAEAIVILVKEASVAGVSNSRFFVSSPDVVTTFGMMELGKLRMYEDA